MWRGGIRAWCGALAIVVASAPCAAVSIEAALELAPADADALVLVPDLTDLNKKIATLNTTLGLNRADLTGVLSAFKRASGLANGVRDDGPMLIALSIDPEKPEPAVRMFVGASDYAGLVSSLGGKADVEVTKVRFATGHEAHAAKCGEFLVISDSAEHVTGLSATGGAAEVLKRIGPAGRRCLDEAQLSFVLHGDDKVAAIRMLMNGLAGSVDGIAKSVGGPPPAAGAAGQGVAGAPGDPGLPLAGGPGGLRGEGVTVWTGGQILGEAFKGLPQHMAEGQDRVAEDPFLRDADGMVMSLVIDDDGIGFNSAAQFREGTEMAGAFKPGSPAMAGLARMPQLPWIGAMSISFDGMEIARAQDLPMLVSGSDASDWVESTLIGGAAKGLRIKGLTQVMYITSGGRMLSSPVSSVKVIETEDVEKLRDALSAKIQGMNGAADEAGMALSTTYDPNDLDVDGSPVGRYLISRKAALDQFGQLKDQLSGMLAGLGSANETKGYIATGKEHVVVTEFDDLNLLRQVLAALESKSGLGADPKLTESRTHLLDDGVMEMYLNLSAALNSPIGSMLLELIGQTRQSPVDMPPLAMGMHVDKSGGVSGRVFLPVENLAFATSVVRKLMPPPATAAGRQDPARNPGFRRPGQFGPPGRFDPGRGLGPNRGFNPRTGMPAGVQRMPAQRFLAPPVVVPPRIP
ncbi:MAG: hypothetical protein CMJ18_18155 [Phycisphaeraceae bacterium]|nr:hypothetical protein [Phycisphaeraceae bacterium]